MVSENPIEPGLLHRVVCRPALPMDTQAVMALTSTIWNGHDYVPDVWLKWLEDPEGLLAVAQLGGCVVGLGKLTKVDGGQWWLEGLRVHPEFEGRGIASHLHDYQLNYWEHHGDGVLRLVTRSDRRPVHHLCERTGFMKTGEFGPFKAPALGDQADSCLPVQAGEVMTAFDFLRGAEYPVLTYGLMDLGWKWAIPTPTLLTPAVKKGMAWWWRDRHGLLILRIDEDEEGSFPYIVVIACKHQETAACLMDYRRLITRLGYIQGCWNAPLLTDLQPILQISGFQSDSDNSLYIYEKVHG
jgi:GNAT superfamily N-acetyltransferase